MIESLPRRGRHYWERHTDGDGRWRPGVEGPPGEDLAALRRGIGREAGSVPPMWRFYTTLAGDGRISRALHAEHIALTLFAVHQQSRPLPAHRAGVGLGSAVRELHDSGKFSGEAVDRRFAAAATATSIAELSVHLRGLIAQLHTLRPGPGLDYTLLFHDLRDWQRTERLAVVRRQWGSQYFVRRPDAGGAEQTDGSPAAEPSATS